MMKNTQKSKVTFYQVDAEHAGRRIDNYLLAKFKGLPKSRLYNLIRKGEIRVNKKRIKPDRRLEEDDEIRVAPIDLSPSKEPRKPSASLTKLLNESILHEDDQFMVINKPVGIAVHGGTGLRVGLIEALRQIHFDKKYLELVHRLDRDTSGCLLVAKKPSALRELQSVMREGNIDKRYQTLTLGQWKNKKNLIDLPLQKNILESGERMVHVNEGGKTSKTIFYQIDSFDGLSLVEAKLLTGRTHQIRVHAAHSGHPIAGDEKYGDKAFNKLMKQRGLKRLFLHAWRLSFDLPWNGERFVIEADLPDELKLFLNELN